MVIDHSADISWDHSTGIKGGHRSGIRDQWAGIRKHSWGRITAGIGDNRVEIRDYRVERIIKMRSEITGLGRKSFHTPRTRQLENFEQLYDHIVL